MFLFLFILISAYLLGSIPSGLLISRFFALEDPRKRDSKSIGATNVLRSGHKGAALLTLVCDALKGSLSVGLALAVSPHLAPFAGIFAVVGHVFPCWVAFKGGKGIATAFGALLILNPLVAGLCLATWFLFLFLTHYVSLSSLITVLLSSLYAFGLGEMGSVWLTIVLTLLILWTHRENISRLRQGREPKFDLRKPPDSAHPK